MLSRAAIRKQLLNSRSSVADAVANERRGYLFKN
jgi:hypothetical protein